MSEEAEVFRRRAEEFLRTAEKLLNEGLTDIAAFAIEQHCQLLLKHKLLIKTGTYPRTHSITRLVEALAQINPEARALLEHILYLTKIEDAYIGARYLPRRYFTKEVEELLRFVREVFDPVVGRL